jgi:Spy/CpxP family protein refolding chaperone
MHGLFERLEATPEQEKVFASASEQLRQAKEKIREELVRLRREVAQALRAEQFNPASIREIFARHDLLISDLRAATLEVLSKIDEALDDRQRKILADLIEPGAGFHPGATGYRGYV